MVKALFKSEESISRWQSAGPTTGSKSTAFSKLLIAHGLFTLLSMWIVVEQAVNFNRALARGMFIPDVVNMTATFDNLWQLYSVIPYEPAFSGVSIIYGWTWLLSPSLSWLINNILMLASGFIYMKYISPTVKGNKWSILVVYINPYVLLASVGPNKEIPLILLSIIWISILISEHPIRWFFALIISFFAYFIRDGFGFILATGTIFSMAWGIASARVPISMLVFGGIVSASFGTLANFSDTLSRNLAVLEQGFDRGTAIGELAASIGLDPLSASGGLALYLVRIVYNSLVLGVFPNFGTVYGFSNFLGYAYWMNGILILISLFSSLYVILNLRRFRKNTFVAFVSFFLISLFAVSISQFVQPRYLMPALPIGLSAVLCLPPYIRKRVLAAALLITFTVVGLYTLAGRRPQPEVIVQIEPPAFVWFD
ncbi:MAG: hypothetical protein IBJ12_02840 [Sphingomonadaceae bacterium]|nr:hypothetical protein [Sphingomonadaceae bacterium]